MPSYSELIQRQSSRKLYAADLVLSRDNGGLETTTLNFCKMDGPISPDKTSIYYEPRIKSIPFYKQRMQEVRIGRSQRSYGSLILSNADGALDTFLNDWTWDGGLITVKQGFPELDIGDFGPVFTGRMKTPRETDLGIALSVTDLQVDFFNTTYTDAGTTDTVPNHVSALLAAVGGITVDSALWSAFSSDNNFNAYVEATDEKVNTLLDRLLAPLACWYGFNRSGEFIIGTFEAPDASTPDMTLGVYSGVDAEILDFQRDTLTQYWDLTVEYISATSPVTYSSVTRSDSSIQTINRNATDTSRRTLLTSLTDAETIRDRWWDLISVQRKITKVPLKVQPCILTPHTQVALERNRYSISGNQRVLGFKEGYDNNQVIVEMFA